MAVKHTKVATVADDGTSEVGTNEWNDDHTIDNNTITDDMVNSHTTTKITVPTTQLSGTVTDSQLAGSITPTKVTGTAAILGANTFTADQTIPATNKFIFGTNTYVYEPTTATPAIVAGNVTKMAWGTLGTSIPATQRFYLDGSTPTGDTYITESSANTIQTYANGVRGMQLFGFGTEVNVSIGAANVLPTASTFGFLQIPTTLGVPTGVPNAVTGKTSICFDQTNLKFMSYVSGVGWKSFSPNGSAIDMGGTDIDNIQNLIHDVSASAGTGMDFSTDQLQTLSRSTTTTFNGSNYATGRSKTLKLLNTSGSTITLGFDSSWKFVGTKPTDLAGNKTAILTLTCFGSTASDVVAAYAVEE